MDLNKVYGGKVLCVGDLHISDVYTGRHKDYLANCFTVLRQITDKIKEIRPSAVVLAGDIIGWSETNIKSREVLSLLCKVLMEWNSISKVYAVRGNHDIKGYPDFNLLCTLGLIIDSSACNGYFDYYAKKSDALPEVRFHLVDYGKEHQTLELAPTGVSNVVIGHNNYEISGKTTWYSGGDGIELGNLENFNGVELVISGHIHNPSPQFISTTMPNGAPCNLFYLGCPTRPIADENNYEYCWYLILGYNADSGQTDIMQERMDLTPVKDLFIDSDKVISEETEDEMAEKIRKEHLSETLQEIISYEIVAGDYEKQIDAIPSASESAKEVAKSYIRKVMGTE